MGGTTPERPGRANNRIQRGGNRLTERANFSGEMRRGPPRRARDTGFCGVGGSQTFEEEEGREGEGKGKFGRGRFLWAEE